MNFLAHTTSFVCSKIRLTALSLCKCKSVFCSVIRHVYVRKIYSSIPKKLKFDWSMQVTCKRKAIVNQIRLSKQFSFEHIHWYSKRKLTNTPALILSYLCRGRWFIFMKQIIVLIWAIIYSCLQKFFKTRVLKTLHNSQKNIGVGGSFKSARACYFFDTRLQPKCFLENFGKLSITPFLQSTLKLLLLILWNISVI